jgi:hypothetical protein
MALAALQSWELSRRSGPIRLPWRRKRSRSGPSRQTAPSGDSKWAPPLGISLISPRRPSHPTCSEATRRAKAAQIKTAAKSEPNPAPSSVGHPSPTQVEAQPSADTASSLLPLTLHPKKNRTLASLSSRNGSTVLKQPRPRLMEPTRLRSTPKLQGARR